MSFFLDSSCYRGRQYWQKQQPYQGWEEITLKLAYKFTNLHWATPSTMSLLYPVKRSDYYYASTLPLKLSIFYTNSIYVFRIILIAVGDFLH